MSKYKSGGQRVNNPRNYQRLIDALEKKEWLIAKEISWRVNNARRGGKELNPQTCATLLRTMALKGLISRMRVSDSSISSRYMYRRI